MKPILASLFLATLAVISPLAASETDEVLQAERDRVTALIQDDYAALDRILSDDLIYTHSSALVETKAQYVASLRSGQLKYKSLEHSDQRVRIHGDVALLTGTSKVYSISNGQDIRLTLRFSIAYIKQAGHWKMALWQSTRIP